MKGLLLFFFMLKIIVSDNIDKNMIKKIELKENFRKPNYIVMLSIVFVITYLMTLVFTYNGGGKPLYEDVISTIPYLLINLFVLHRFRHVISPAGKDNFKSTEFLQDCLIINYCYTLATLVSILFASNNSDVKAWWSLAIYILWACGILFTLCYAYLCKLLPKSHKRYTITSGVILFLVIALIPFYPRYLSVFGLWNIDVSIAILIYLIGFHIVGIALIYCLKKKINSQ